MWGAFFAIQILCHLTYYAIPIPSNAEIYIEQFRDLIEFKMFKPDNFLAIIDPKWSIKYFMGINKQKLTGALQSSGIVTGNIVYNLATFLFIAAAGVVAFLLVASILIFRRFSEKIFKLVKEKLKAVLNKMWFNGQIKAHSVAYLKYCTTFSVFA